MEHDDPKRDLLLRRLGLPASEEHPRAARELVPGRVTGLQPMPPGYRGAAKPGSRTLVEGEYGYEAEHGYDFGNRSENVERGDDQGTRWRSVFDAPHVDDLARDPAAHVSGAVQQVRKTAAGAQPLGPVIEMPDDYVGKPDIEMPDDYVGKPDIEMPEDYVGKPDIAMPDDYVGKTGGRIQGPAARAQQGEKGQAGVPGAEGERFSGQVRTLNAQLVGDLLQAIDHSARTGLKCLAGQSPDVDAANVVAGQLAARIEHLLSITALPGGVAAELSSFKHDAELALGRSEQFARDLTRAGGTYELIETALTNASFEIAAAANWHWKPTGIGKAPVGHGFVRKDGLRIGTGTLAMVAHRARGVANAKEPSVVKVTAQACKEDLVHAHRELALAVATNAELRQGLVDDVLHVGEALAVLEGAAFRLGIGEDGAVNAMRDAESSLRGLINLPTPRPFWDSAVPTLNAIVEIINEWHVVDRSKGVAQPKWHPSQHREVPARYRPLLDEWFLITHGSIKQTDGSKVQIRGAMLATHIDLAIADTMALINLIQKEADPSTLDILDDFFPKVAELRHSATEEIVDDAVEVKAKDPLEHGESPIDQLSQEHQLKLASMRLMTVARALTSSAQRLASAGKNEAKIAIEAFKKEFENADVPPALREKLASATSLADVATHIGGLATGIQAVLNVADPEQRKRLFHTEFEKYGIKGGATEILKTLGGLAQGGVAAYGIAGYALLRARGFQVEASKLFAGTSKTLGSVSPAVNLLNVIHGTIMLVDGETTGEKVSGAVEAAWGTLGLVAWKAQRLARFTGPLSAALMISWTTINWIGEKTMGALYGLIRWGLNMAFDDMKTHAREIHGEATRLAVMLEMGSSLDDPDQIAELHKRIVTFTHILASSIRSYVERTQVPGRNQDPGTWRAFRTRFKPLVGISLDTEIDVLLASEQFLELVVSCFENAGQVLEESLEQSLDEHGEANKHRF